MEGEDSKIKALISLLDDEDSEVVHMVEKEILSMGEAIIPYLESEWEKNFNPLVQKRIEDLVHTVHFDLLKSRLIAWKEGGGEDLLEGMWLVATYQYPDLELSKLKSQLEQIYYESWVQMGDQVQNPYDQVKTINNLLFNQLKFGPNSKNFHSPSNSMLNIVLESKKGNPISLCVIYMLVAQRLKLPMYGVNLPNLFILTYKTEDTCFYVNAFHKGIVFTRQDIDHYLSQLNLSPMDIFYEPCTHLDILKRVFRNLIVSFEKLGDSFKVEEIKLLLSCISDEKVE